MRGFSSVRLVPEGGGGVRRDGIEAPRASALPTTASVRAAVREAAAVTGSPLVPGAESAHSEPTGPG